MRIRLPRSPSPSPVRRPKRQENRRSSTYGLYSSSSSSESSSDESSVSSGDSWLDSDDDGEYKDGPSLSDPVDAELRQIEEAVASIRLRARHKDPYEDWERQAHKDAFHVARREQAVARARSDAARIAARDGDLKRQSAHLVREIDLAAQQLAATRARAQTAHSEQLSRWTRVDTARRTGVDAVIRMAEERVRALEAEERRVREEAERARAKEEEERRAAEARRREEEERRRREEEEERRRVEVEEERARREQAAEQAQAEQTQERRALGLTTPLEDWLEARRMLKQLKAGPIATVKAGKESKKLWNEKRRQITPRVGQLTNDAASIAQVTQHIRAAVLTPQLPEPIRLAVLSTVAKAILLQAETEVVAEPRSAAPLALTAAGLLASLDGLADVLWARLVQRTGGWAVPAPVPATEDIDASGARVRFENDAARAKATGRRDGETPAEFTARVAGVMRVYFGILLAQVGDRPLPRAAFQRPRFWTYFARLIGQPRLLATPVAAELLTVALDVGGVEARRVYGRQWTKLLSLLYASVTSPADSDERRRIGGDAPEAQGTRVRLQLAIERVMAGP